MKIFITESQFKRIISESYDLDDYYELMTNTEWEVLENIKNKKKIGFPLINPNQYKRALDEFMLYGKIIKFPERIIFEWKDLCLENIVLLRVLTDINGHSSHFPHDVLYDVFPKDFPPKKQKYNFQLEYGVLEDKYHIDDYIPFFSNGHAVLTDYGLEPLEKLAAKLIPMTDVNDILVTINMIMDVAHQRSDLSELFLEGGQKSHYSISNS